MSMRRALTSFYRPEIPLSHLVPTFLVGKKIAIYIPKPVLVPVLTWLSTLLDKEINAIVSDKQKDDAKLRHEKSDVEQLKQEVANYKKNTRKISEVLEKKVFPRLSIPLLMSYFQSSFLTVWSI